MHRRPSPSADDGREWHALVERYTPDGAPGRLLLGAITGSVAAFFSFLALVLLVSPAGPLAALVGLLAAASSLLVWLLTAATLWPVYLSRIGNLASAADYRPGRVTTSPSPGSDEEALAILKRRYAAGELSEEAFERRLDDILEAEDAVRHGAVADSRRSGGADGRRNADALPEGERE